MALSKDEVENIRHESQKTEHKAEKPIESPKKSRKIMLISSLVVVLIVAGVVFSFVNSQKPGYLDGFAQCLTEKGAVMYGASFCKYSSAQKGMFGNSFKFVDYRDFGENSDVRVTPTWFIDGNKYENVQSLDRLASVTGCVIGR